MNLLHVEFPRDPRIDVTLLQSRTRGRAAREWQELLSLWEMEYREYTIASLHERRNATTFLADVTLVRHVLFKPGEAQKGRRTF